MPHTLRTLLLLLLLTGVVFGVGPVRADEDEDDGPPLDPGPGADLGESAVPFAEQVNLAIEGGTRWLRARAETFRMEGTDPSGLEAAFWGHIRGERLYGGGEGEGYPHPAGPTALALYTLLKCGVDPDDPAIEKGFNWLRENHRIDPKYDGFTAQRPWHWNHTAAAGSYELSAMILALTAKYDPYKKSSQTEVVRRKGRLKIKNREDRRWLFKLVQGLVGRRGRPGPQAIPVTEAEVRKIGRLDKDKYKEDNLPPPQGFDAPESKLGWRYNLPFLGLRYGSPSKGGGTMGRQVGRPPHGNQDLSSTQLAALALFAAHQFGVEVEEQVWLDIVEFTLSHQEPEGPEHQRPSAGYTSGTPPTDRARGFMYLKGSPDQGEGIATGAMTACGVANLLMAKQVLTSSSKGRKRWSEQALDRKVETAIWDGLAWLDKNWSSFENPRKGGYHTYYLYAIERAQDLREKELLGRHLWYREGAEQLLARQKTEKRTDVFDGEEVEGVFWHTNSTHEPKDVLDTCFALLFLKRATRGVAPPVTPGG